MVEKKLPYRIASGYSPTELAAAMNALHAEGYRFVSIYSSNNVFIAVMVLSE